MSYPLNFQIFDVDLIEDFITLDKTETLRLKLCE